MGPLPPSPAAGTAHGPAQPGPAPPTARTPLQARGCRAGPSRGREEAGGAGRGGSSPPARGRFRSGVGGRAAPGGDKAEEAGISRALPQQVPARHSAAAGGGAATDRPHAVRLQDDAGERRGRKVGAGQREGEKMEPRRRRGASLPSPALSWPRGCGMGLPLPPHSFYFFLYFFFSFFLSFFPSFPLPPPSVPFFLSFPSFPSLTSGPTRQTGSLARSQRRGGSGPTPLPNVPPPLWGRPASRPLCAPLYVSFWQFMALKFSKLARNEPRVRGGWFCSELRGKMVSASCAAPGRAGPLPLRAGGSASPCGARGGPCPAGGAKRVLNDAAPIG